MSHLAFADFLDELPELKPSPAIPGANETNIPGVPPGSQNTGKPGIPSAPGSSSLQEPNSPKGSGPAEAPTTGAAVTSGAAAPSPTATRSPGGGLLSPDVLTHDNSAPIQTVGDELEGSLQKGRTKLRGNVVITQGDAEMKSDEAEIFSAPNTTTPQRAIARGNVRLWKRPNPKVPEIRGVAEEIEYFVLERRVVLKGKPKIWRAQELIQGEVIEMALDTGDIKIRSARSILDPKSSPDIKKK